MRPMIRRRLNDFGLDLLWDGGQDIKVLDGNRVIEVISTGSRGLVSAADTMKQIEADYYRAACAMG